MSKKLQITNKRAKTPLKQGDEVILIAGKDKGKRGAIKQVVRLADRVKLKIEGVNMVKKHVRANPNTNEQGGIILKEALVDSSNVMLFDSSAQKGRRIGMKVVDDRKVRCYKVDNKLVEIEA